MSRKNGLNRKEQLRCAKMLTAKVPAKIIAKEFGTSEEVVKKFTQEALDKAAGKAKARAESQGKVAKKQKAQAKVLKDAIDLTKEDAKDDKDFE